MPSIPCLRLPRSLRTLHAVLPGLLLAASAGALAEGLTVPSEPKPTRFEGAIGMVSSYKPEFSGAGAHAWSFAPAGFIRYGRITISGAGGFTTRRDDDVERGLAAALVNKDKFRLSAGLRFDNGRSESDSDRLAGMGNIDATVRTQIIARYRPDRDWQFSTSLSLDSLARGGGWWGDFSVRRQWHLSPQTKLSVSSALTYAGDTYLQSWYGVTEEQSSRSGYPVYKPAEGLRDFGIGMTLRSELGPHWSGFVSAGSNWLLGPAADSPLVTRRFGWGLGGGLAWRF